MLGSGEPLLLVSPVLADGFAPLQSESALADRFQLIGYHRRGWVGSTHTPPPVTIDDHATDAAALLESLGIPRAHVCGHSSGAAVALELALGRPELVHSLALLEPSLLTVPSAGAFFQAVGPAFEAYAAGEHDEALAIFLTAVSGLDWDTCRAVIERSVPGAVAQAVKDAETFFGVELPGLADWTLDRERAAGVRQPALSVVGTETQTLWVEVADFLRTSLPHGEDSAIEGVGHLLHIQRPEPVARAIAAFLGRHPMTAG